MKLFSEKSKTNLGCLFIIGIILSCIIYWIYDDHNTNYLFKHGKQTIGFVFKKTYGRTPGSLAHFYINVQGFSYENSCSSSNIKFSIVNNFFIVYYDPKNPKNSIMDFTKWVNPDSVETYFPKGQCPFTREIWKAKGLIEE